MQGNVVVEATEVGGVTTVADDNTFQMMTNDCF
jgi:hypothetical protein